MPPRVFETVKPYTFVLCGTIGGDPWHCLGDFLSLGIGDSGYKLQMIIFLPSKFRNPMIGREKTCTSKVITQALYLRWHSARPF
jgi:hypothetical protein